MELGRSSPIPRILKLEAMRSSAGLDVGLERERQGKDGMSSYKDAFLSLRRGAYQDRFWSKVRSQLWY